MTTDACNFGASPHSKICCFRGTSALHTSKLSRPQMIVTVLLSFPFDGLPCNENVDGTFSLSETVIRPMSEYISLPSSVFTGCKRRPTMSVSGISIKAFSDGRRATMHHNIGRSSGQSVCMLTSSKLPLHWQSILAPSSCANFPKSE